MTKLLRAGWDYLSLDLPVVLMGVLALGTYWLVRSTPQMLASPPASPTLHEADYFMHKFSVKTFDEFGRLKSEMLGADARHYPDTDTLEIDFVRVRSMDHDGHLTTASAKRAVTNGDASEVQLFGAAHVVREPGADKTDASQVRSEFRGEFLQAFTASGKIQSHLPVEFIHGKDRITADALDFDDQEHLLQLKGRIKGTLMPGVTR